jgi:sugar phosphate isomerase/epimerase
MIDPGIFERTFPRPTLEATLDAVAAHGIRHIQLDLASADLDSIPRDIPNDTARRIHDACRERDISIAAVSGTWNMIHPDPAVRDAGLAGLEVIAGACHAMGTSIITLCTGTRNAESMWRRHPDNDTPAAWCDLVSTMTAALEIADAHNMVLAFEPEPANVISSAAKGRDLLQELDHPRLKVVMDAANVIATDRSRPPEAVLDEAFDLLGEHIVVAHGKDLSADGAFCAAGTGIVPWDRCLARFRSIAFDGPIILHSLDEDEVETSLAYMRERITASAAS